MNINEDKIKRKLIQIKKFLRKNRFNLVPGIFQGRVEWLPTTSLLYKNENGFCNDELISADELWNSDGE